MKLQADAISITRAGKEDAKLLSALAKQTLLESHADSPAAAGLNKYVNENYSEEVLEAELKDERNIYQVISYHGRKAGYSKLLFNIPLPGGGKKNMAKLERIYLLEEFYDLKLGLKLLQSNIDLSRINRQEGIWLYTWIDNLRAIRFYEKNGFVKAGSHDFRITETLSNPNYLMVLQFQPGKTGIAKSRSSGS
jgi:ribosomal protein S18 acetylase RimI-like enzyme